MDLETFLALEKENLQVERERLSARSTGRLHNKNLESDLQQQQIDDSTDCVASQILQNKEYASKVKCNRSTNYEKEKDCFQQEDTASNGQHRKDNSFGKGLQSEGNDRPPPTAFNELPKATTITTNTMSSQRESSIGGCGVGLPLSKIDKDMANHKELSAVATESGNGSEGAKKLNIRSKNKDDMEQWVSDTFYSYFPGYNNEYQKRQNYLRDRQLENQQNFLKHQMSHPPPVKHAALKSKDSIAAPHATVNTTGRSSATNSSTDKTDLEIIVNNPNYVPSKSTTRPGSTRHKLLQDLRHIELSNIITGDGVLERNRHSAEIELARKKDYQRELMQQIEEKRRSIEVLREKERRQEEALTRRLQDQLKTIKLEEELEKERLKVDKLRFDTEQNRIMREHLLSKLENDSKLLYAANTNKTKFKIDRNKDAAPSTKSSGESSNENNKVYKYFSNSARHEYRRGKPLPADVELDLEIPESLSTQNSNTERECFHLSEKVCPMCDVPLKSYESCCLRCQRKLSLKVRQINAKKESGEAGQNEANDVDIDAVPCHAYSLVCSKCERLYTLCPTCLAKSDVCRACHRQRNVCMNCRRTLCSFCLEEIACGRDTEQCHVNEQSGDVENKVPANKNVSGGSERSFKVLDVNYASQKLSSDEDVRVDKPANFPNNIKYNNNNNYAHNNRPPYSINIERNSIFHPSYEPSNQTTASLEQLPKIIDKNLNFELDSSAQTDENSNIEHLRKETDKRLSRFLKNYGDLAISRTARSQSESRDRSTQTTPLGSARRDIVLHEEHNLSMPLLREMPRMTRKETTQLLERSNTRLIKNLSRRWEIPAVQKFIISPTSPPVLTQVGAIRKQLQADRLLADDY